MNLRYLGDSYDIVKRSLLSWLSIFGEWQAHPMFTCEVSPIEARAFERLIGVPLLSREVLTRRANRGDYFALCANAGNLFLDPDVGVSIGRARSSPAHLFATEVVRLSQERSNRLTLVFDQSFSRGAGDKDYDRKLAFFGEQGLTACYYRSHASFLLMSPNAAIVERARVHLVESVGLPAQRIVTHGVSRVGQGWVAEAERRFEELKAGTARTIPSEEVFATLATRHEE